MSIETPNRYRVSTNFTYVKIGIAIVCLSVGVSLIRLILDNSFEFSDLFSLVIALAILLGTFYFISTRKRVDYDDIKQCLYEVDLRNNLETEVPVERIEKILASALGGSLARTYKIYYRGFRNDERKIWLFTIPFDNSIDTIITDCRLKNPELTTRNWSFGWNEFFD